MFDQLIPRQRKMTTRLGGFLVLMSETMFLFSILNFLMISRLQYYSSGDSYIRAVFPHYLLFLGAMGLVGITAMWIIYVYILPSKQRFAEEQAVKDNRSPTYDKILQVQAEIAEMRKMMEELSVKIEKLAEQKTKGS
ncbi:hypothetical protein FXV91_12935 [Methanosarcina sp. DH2]|uniref:hypothetical protein n=1 Tax=Methanosarcina sp. DH2 TaxID=2605639 RepID=UPI001E5EEB5C|nr:hypothetical protein [Methanosarcina sp. DH2]MCC4771039.1 hypothetical protein [Methanosarcina sp. DH2]